mmetsp:Transcript_8895/g.23261  ORF Transcript_8895/g.23261 Transcript_8895/m.23261 type:complete len:434 (+) Transcript_8895:509-1810(+)
MTPTSVSRLSSCRGSAPCPSWGGASKSRNATVSVRSPSLANCPSSSSALARCCGVRGETDPSGLSTESHRARTTSAAPFVKSRCTCRLAPGLPRASVVDSKGTPVLIIFLSEVKGIETLPGVSIGYRARMSAWLDLPLRSSSAKARSAHSVSLPSLRSTFPSGDSSTSLLKEELITTVLASVALYTSGAVSKEHLSSYKWPPHRRRTTVIRPVVRVPVLSLQMVVADPMVSQALRCRTRFWSAIIFLTEKARAMVTARGRPSGTATTKMVMPVMTNPRISDQCTRWSHVSKQHLPPWKARPMRIRRMMTRAMDTHIDTVVMRSVMASSFRCRIERPESASFIFSAMLPWYVLGPTARTRRRPSPSCTKVPAKSDGEDTTDLPLMTYWGLFFFITVSPVSIFSLMARSLRPMTMPSAGRTSPVLSRTMSPTTSS